MVLKVTPMNDDSIQLMRPHVVLTPICPQCYCEQYISNEFDLKSDNISPMFVYPDGNRHLVPLLPECLVKKLDGQANTEGNNAAFIFWPKEYKDILFSGFVRLAKQLEQDTKEDNDDS